MNSIQKKITVRKNSGQAFHAFVHEFNEWWPKDYTWSQDALKEIRIAGKENGLCSETGPHGFRCDWGRVTEFVENEKIGLKWQISPKREPIPNPEYASDIKITFQPKENSSTEVVLEHLNFENHGEGAENYREMMDSQYGWESILDNYRSYCEE